MKFSRLVDSLRRWFQFSGSKVFQSLTAEPVIEAPLSISPEPCSTEISHDPEQPRAKAFSVAEFPKAEKTRKERLLYDILSVRRPDHSACKPERSRSMAVDEHSKRRLVTGQNALDNRFVRC